MAVSTTVLGMNARNFLYIRRYNYKGAKRVADNKLLTKRVLIKNHLATPRIYAIFGSRKKLRDFNWSKLPANGFVIKPARGYAGGGIMAFAKWYGDHGITVSGDIVNTAQIETQLLDILDGAYSLQNLPDVAFVEELITPHPFFKKLNAVGLPDIRVIVLHSVPVMAEVRLPTKESGGKANLMQGALGLGIDMRTGITNFAYFKYKKDPKYVPGTKIKVRGIKIPLWDEVLLLSARAQEASKLGFAGVDIVIDAVKGPMVMEINARPGLNIQSVNLKSLRTRLERIENMKNITPERGVEVAKSLFTEPFSEKVSISPTVVGVVETVTVVGKDDQMTAKARIDTGAYRTSIDITLFKALGLEYTDKIVTVNSALGTEERKTARITIVLGDNRIKTLASVTERIGLKYPIIIGRKDLKGFLVDPVRNLEEVDLSSEPQK